MEKSYTIKGKLFNFLKQLSYQEYEKWESINKGKGRRQCFNSPRSCIVGCLSEYAVKLYLKEQRNENIKQILLKAFKERKLKNYNSDCDLEIEMTDKNYKVEVKGITKGQNRGQITPYHLKKYIKQGIDALFFVEVDFDYETSTAECIVYIKTIPEFAKKWPLMENHYGKECHTHPDYC